ncbi:ExbD/TolR family protein [Flagellimonas pacifica]|uniref:Biopolymer transport protein ExbD n=1 Tax=Flagellimonas pacifica TaxID=1247520 RepID=A0A285MZ87_9FLAO|nr:biopolymer transporter ExbD [Allomuricauda parva]SNZ01106.1 Biopolymer transport protein ExbD [Allomuricauda parva]
MVRNNEVPEVNAGSMADIAFLLLIFFLVTTTIQTDVGLDRKLPPKDTTPPLPVNERNIFRVSLNKNNELWIESDLRKIEDLKSEAIAFLDNGGNPISNENHCSYCQGNASSSASDNPQKAIISFASDREATYGMYVMVQNELTAAYNELRNREAQRLFGRDFVEMERAYFDAKTKAKEKIELKKNIYQIRNMYPMNLSEAKTNMNL